MATQVKFRRDTRANLLLSTPVEGEIGVDTTNDRLILGDGSTSGGLPQASYKDIQNNLFTSVDSSGTDTLTLTFDDAPTAYAEYQRFTFKPAANNTGAVTLNVNALGAKNVKKDDGSGTLVDLEADDLKDGIPVDVIYDGVQFVLFSGGGGAGAYKVLSEVDISSDATVDFSSSVISGYNNYIIEFTAVKPATDGSSFLFRCSTDGGATYSSASTYITFGRQTANSGAGADIGGAASTSGSLTPSGVGNSTHEDGVNGSLVMQSPASTGYNMFRIGTNYTTATPTFQNFNGGCFLNTSPFTGSGVNGIRFLMSSGNIASGKIRVLGA